MSSSSASAAPAAAVVYYKPLKVEYCSSCSMPPEYCEFGPSFAACRLLLEKNHPELLAAALEKMVVKGSSAGSAAAAPAAAAAISTAASAVESTPASSSASSSSASSSSKPKRAAGDDDDDDSDSDDDDAPSAAPAAAADDDDFMSAASTIVAKVPKKVAPASAGVYLSLTSRSKRKFITTIRGLDSFGLVLKDVAKVLAKKFACAASVVKASESAGGNEIAIQGDLLQDLPIWMVDEYKQIDKKLMWTVDKAGKKVKCQF